MLFGPFPPHPGGSVEAVSAGGGEGGGGGGGGGGVAEDGRVVQGTDVQLAGQLGGEMEEKTGDFENGKHTFAFIISTTKIYGVKQVT